MNPSELVRQALTTGCPPFEDLTAAYEQTLAPEQSRSIQLHIQSCQACSANWRLIEEFHTAEPTPAERADVSFITQRLEARFSPRKPSLLSRLFAFPALPKFAMAAAALVVTLAVGIQYRASHPDLQKISTGGELRSSPTLNITPSGDITSVPTAVEWTAVPNAARYEITLTEVDGSELWKSTSSVNSVILPPSIAARILPYKTLILRVTAFTANNQAAAQSQPTPFRLKP